MTAEYTVTFWTETKPGYHVPEDFEVTAKSEDAALARAIEDHPEHDGKPASIALNGELA
jgi:hypothetical protein